MTLLTPLGFLGLLGIVALILIYILKPNYQQKVVSSTFVWKLSLRYRKKRIPISRLRNILILICQVLILVSCAFLLTQPVIRDKKVSTNTERVFIIDASASMLMEDHGETRFERAVGLVRSDVELVFISEGTVSIILADDEPRFLIERETSLNSAEVLNTLDMLVLYDEDGIDCSYSSADMDKAVALAEQITIENPEAEVVFYTATTYIDVGKIKVEDVSSENDWNAAILDCTATLVENFYTITIQVGCYGKSVDLNVICEIMAPNDDYSTTAYLSATERFNIYETEKTIVFNSDDFELYSYDEIYVRIEDANDSFAEDNFIYLYGGTRETLNVQYVSSLKNNFFQSAIMSLQTQHVNNMDYNIHVFSSEDEYYEEGMDLYIFEHELPRTLPTDGVVFVVDPDSTPVNAGFTVAGKYGLSASDIALSAGTPHPLTKGINPERITIAAFNRITASNGYEELLYFGNYPILLAKNEPDEKVVVLALDLNYSSLAVHKDFPMLILNIIRYYFPLTLAGGYTYEIGEEVAITIRGQEMEISGPIETIALEESSSISVRKPGTYTITQYLPIISEYRIENFFVKIPNIESNITKEVDALPTLYREEIEEEEDTDLLMYFAIALVALLFVEWWLQSREYF